MILTAYELRGAFARAGIQTELSAVAGGEHQVGFVVRYDPRGDRAEVLKHVTDIERIRKRGQQGVERVQLCELCPRGLCHRRHATVSLG